MAPARAQQMPMFAEPAPERKVAQEERRPSAPQVAGSSPALPAIAFVTLKGGLIVREDAIAFVLALENRGIALTVRDGQLRMPTGTVLTLEEQEIGKRLRLQLLAIAGYAAPAI